MFGAFCRCSYHASTQLLAISEGVVEPRRPVELWTYLGSIFTGAALYAAYVSVPADTAVAPDYLLHAHITNCSRSAKG